MSEKVIFQDNAITKGKYNLSSMAKDAFLMMLRQLKREDEDKKMYYISTKEWAEIKGVSKLKFAEVDKALDELRDTNIFIMRENGNILKTKFVSSVEYIKGTGVVEIGISPKIRPFFVDLRRTFTAYQLKMALSLNSGYAKRWYEILCMDAFKKTVTYSVNEIRDWFDLNDLDITTGKAKLTRWSDFERIVIKQAQRLLAEHTDISFTYEAKALEGGKAVSHVVFYIQKSTYQEKIRFEDVNNESYPRLVGEFGLSKKQALQVIETMTDKEIRQKFHQIKTTHDNKRGSVGGYSAKVFGV